MGSHFVDGDTDTPRWKRLSEAHPVVGGRVGAGCSPPLPPSTLPRDGFQEAWGILYRGYLSTVFPGGGGVASPTS